MNSLKNLNTIKKNKSNVKKKELKILFRFKKITKNKKTKDNCYIRRTRPKKPKKNMTNVQSSEEEVKNVQIDSQSYISSSNDNEDFNFFDINQNMDSKPMKSTYDLTNIFSPDCMSLFGEANIIYDMSDPTKKNIKWGKYFLYIY